MSLVIEAVTSPVHGVLPTPAGIPMPQEQVQDGTPWYKRAATCVALVGSMIAGGCVSAEDSSPNSTSSPSVSTTREGRSSEQPLPALAGKIGINVLIATVAGDTTSRGFTERNTVQLTENAATKITHATGGKVTFGAPNFVGSVQVQVPNAKDRCKVNDQNSLDTTFRDTFTKVATNEAAKLGYEETKTPATGLIVFANYKCKEWMRSTASESIFTPQNNALITSTPDSLADGGSEDETLPHELGHLLGLEHANAYEDKPSNVPLDNRKKIEYGSLRSLMGPTNETTNDAAKPDHNVHFNGYELYRLGALSDDERLELETPGTHRVNLTALQPGKGDVQIIRIPRKYDTDKGFQPGGSHYWIELSPGGRDNENLTGCKYTKTDLKDCEFPRRLSVAMYTANNGDWKYSSHTYQIPLAPITDPSKHMEEGGIMEPDKDKVVFKDPLTGLEVTVLGLQDSRGGDGSAQLEIELTKDLRRPVTTPTN